MSHLVCQSRMQVMQRCWQDCWGYWQQDFANTGQVLFSSSSRSVQHLFVFTTHQSHYNSQLTIVIMFVLKLKMAKPFQMNGKYLLTNTCAQSNAHVMKDLKVKSKQNGKIMGKMYLGNTVEVFSRVKKERDLHLKWWNGQTMKHLGKGVLMNVTKKSLSPTTIKNSNYNL